MKRDAWVVGGAALLLATASCALVSGLSSLDVGETVDASLDDVFVADVAKPDAVVDGGGTTDSPSPPPTDTGVADAPRDSAIETGPPSIQCGASACPLTLSCCHKLFPSSFTCSDASSCQYPITCDALSCKPGEVCCVTAFSGIGSSTACATTCNSPNVRLCAADGGPACPNGLKCLPSDGGFVPYSICK